jgi:hypothetical protein
MINLERSLTKSQRRKIKKRDAEAQRIELRELRKRRYRRRRQKTKKNMFDSELKRN